MIDLIDLRRKLHQTPELALHLPKTRQLLLDALEPLGLQTHTSERCSSIAVVIPGIGPGPTVLLRADMDGLPVTEESGEEFASRNGNMHACGHDLHMAGLVGAVHELHRRRAEFGGDVLAIFQPGEEGAGGAELMLGEQTHLVTGRAPVASYAVHVLSYVESGMFQCRDGEVMGAAIAFDLELLGRGGHAARPHTALDPISTAALVVQAIQTYVAQRNSPTAPIVVTIGSLTAGSVANAIPSRALLKVCLRASSREHARFTYAKIRDVAAAIVESYGLRLKATVGADLGPTANNAEGAALVRRTVRDLFGDHRYNEMLVPEMLAEDFSVILEETGGAFLLVGAAIGSDPAVLATNHSPDVRFDDSVVPDVASLLAELAIRQLSTTTNGATVRGQAADQLARHSR